MHGWPTAYLLKIIINQNNNALYLPNSSPCFKSRVHMYDLYGHKGHCMINVNIRIKNLFFAFTLYIYIRVQICSCWRQDLRNVHGHSVVGIFIRGTKGIWLLMLLLSLLNIVQCSSLV